MFAKKHIKIFLLFLALMVMGFSFYRMYNKPGLDVDEVSSEVKISWIDLVNSFEKDEKKASELYMDKVIEVTGKIIDISESDKSLVIVLGDPDKDISVICQIPDNELESIPEVAVGDELVIKGYCTGYLMDVMLIRCKIVNSRS